MWFDGAPKRQRSGNRRKLAPAAEIARPAVKAHQHIIETAGGGETTLQVE
ncbi:hypothetical protein ECZU25_24810 [Escherichia coli]|nr:hypothetical protein ECZU24_05670 [Escherichia coli]GHL25668.1 hypothetical protein ECZU25_24810 [Escherichia coli]